MAIPIHHIISVLLATVLLITTIAPSTTSLSNTTVATNPTTFLANATIASNATIALAKSTQPTAYKMLQSYGFPPGILPAGVTDYILRSDGSFEAHLARECEIGMEKLKVHYSSRIAGNIQNGSIHGMEGVKVKVLLSWYGIREIERDGDDLHFHAGLLKKSFPVNDFSSSPQCS
ncbi:hypothetical protein ACP4OV_015158 [Aristida adscensionis]